MMPYKFLLALGALTATCFSTARAFDAYGDDDDGGTNATAQTIIGGEIIEEGSRPYLVSIGAGESGTGQSCGGSLISPHAVMTAAHCLFKKLDEPVNGKNYAWDPPEWVEFHRHDLCDDSGVVRLYLESDESQMSGDMFYHIDYDWDTNVNDVAVLFLPTPINDIKPVILNTDPQMPVNKEPLDVAGWGLADEGNGPTPRSYPRYPRAVTINYLTNEACTSELYWWDTSDVTDQMMCATADDKDICRGDSGGPLVLGKNRRKGGPKKPIVQVGIVSFSSKQCNLAGYPGVYTRVSSVVDWVKKTVCERTGDELCQESRKKKEKGSSLRHLKPKNEHEYSHRSLKTNDTPMPTLSPTGMTTYTCMVEEPKSKSGKQGKDPKSSKSNSTKPKSSKSKSNNIIFD